jgi:hypothetical protein
MRSLFLLLLLANLLFIAVQFNVFGDLVHEPHDTSRPPPISAERLRVIRDTSARALPSERTSPATTH